MLYVSASFQNIYSIKKGTTLQCPCRIESQSLISFDHTFKVAANIGYLRDDGKWITQYNSVMIIMNEDGLVMGWQFTKTTRIRMKLKSYS